MLSISKVGQVVFGKCYFWRIIRITRRYARHKHERLFKTDWFSKKNPIRWKSPVALYNIHSCAFQKLCYCSKRALFQKKHLSRRRLLPTKKAEQPPLAAKLPSFKTSGCFQGVGYFAPFSAPALSFLVSNPNRFLDEGLLNSRGPDLVISISDLLITSVEMLYRVLFVYP